MTHSQFHRVLMRIYITIQCNSSSFCLMSSVSRDSPIAESKHVTKKFTRIPLNIRVMAYNGSRHKRQRKIHFHSKPLDGIKNWAWPLVDSITLMILTLHWVHHCREAHVKFHNHEFCHFYHILPTEMIGNQLEILKITN